MRRSIFLVVAVVGLTPAASRAQSSVEPTADVYVPRMLSVDSARADVALLRKALEGIHPGLYRYASKAEIDAAFARLEARAERPMDELEMYREVSLLLALLRCDHTKAELPAGFARFRRERPTHLPFRFRLFDGRMYVASSDSAQAPLRRGTEVLSIDGVSVEDLLAALEPAVSFDGLTSFVRAAKLEADSDLMGTAFDHFHPVFFGVPGPDLRLEVRAPGETDARTVEMRRVPFPRWTELAWTSKPYNADFADEIGASMLTPRTALLRVNTFVNYRKPVDPMIAYGEVFRRFREAGADSLVVDLRENGGGSDDAAIALARFLVDTSFAISHPPRLKAVRYDPDVVRHVQTWGDPRAIFEPPLERFTRTPDGWFQEVATGEKAAPSPDRFRGPVTVLVGPRNGSGATILVAALRDAGRVRLVGEETGGSAEGPTAGRIFFLKLPHSGVTVRVPVKQGRTNVRAFRPGMGVAPDVAVAPTFADFLAGRDPVLEAALR